MSSYFPLRILDHKSGKFSVFDPRKRPEIEYFDILSYTWGPTRKSQDAYDCGIPGVNWAVILRKERIDDIKRLMEQKDLRYLWVDSLCLNQSDEQEKNSEIAKMYQYYKNARRCHIMIDMKEVWHPQEILDDL